MKNISPVVWVVLVCVGALGCQQIDGACWSVSEDGQGSGAGGGPIVPSTGGYGDAPTPKPLGEPNYPTDPCMQQAECTVTWKVGSSSCGAAGDPGCTNLHRGHYATLEDAKKDCEKIYGINPPTGSGALSCDGCKWVTSGADDCLEHCKDLCYEIWVNCRKDCPKGDGNCLSECTNKLAECNKECEKKCK